MIKGNPQFPRGTKFSEAFPEIVEKYWNFNSNCFQPSEISCANSRKKVNLVCDNGHEFSITPYNLKYGNWCKHCFLDKQSDTMKKALFNKDNSFGKRNKNRVKNWSDKNNISPFEVMAFSRDKYLFICDNGHEFDSKLENVTSGKWCPYCSGHKVCLENSFAYYNEKLVKYWSNENDKSPFEVTKSSDYIAKFICECGNKIKMRCSDVTNGRWCSSCSNRPKINNEIVDLRLKGKDFSRIGNYINARTKLEFKCLKCHSHFKVIPDNIFNKGTGCPSCKSSKGEKEVLRVLNKFNLKYESQYSFADLRGINNGLLLFDFVVFINSSKIAIEYDGEFHFTKMYDNDGHEVIVEHDKRKNEYCKKNNIEIIRIPYWEFENVEKILLEKIVNKYINTEPSY